MEYKFSKKPSKKQLKIIAKIISWNIWQMDGITMNVPFTRKQKATVQINFFNDLNKDISSEIEQIPCKIFDWRSNNSLEFASMLKRGGTNGKK